MLSARKKCICQLCTCGRHMCVHRNKDTHLVLGEDSASELRGRHLETKEKRGQEANQWNLTNGETQDVSAEVDQINAQQVLANAERRETSLTVQDKGNSQVNVSSTGNSWSTKQVPKTLPIRPPDNLKPSGEADFTTLHQINYSQKSSNFTSQAVSSNAQNDSWNHKQIPKTLPIRKPDSLTLSGPLILETTNKSDFTENIFQSKATESVQGEKSPRPRTSLKLSGEFQSDSSYQRAFTPKHATDVVKVKKGTTVSHLKPEGDMSFDTTSLDYRAALIEKSKLESETERSIPLKPKPAKPQSGIKIPEVPLEDETTAVTDYKRWNVEKPERYRPADTLQLGDGFTEVEESTLSLVRKELSDANAKSNDPRWQVSRPVVRKPQNNLRTEESFATANDVDYTSRRSRYSQSNLETVAERAERETVEEEEFRKREKREIQTISESKTAQINTAELENSATALQKESEAVSVKDIQKDTHFQDQVSQPKATDIESSKVSQSVKGYEQHEDNIGYTSLNGEQMEYVTWDQIRPKPIRPHSNLRQEGGMDFSTTNRSEYIQRPTERVKGIRPKTTTKVFEGDFDATTMNQIMFTHDQVERVNPIRPKSNLHLENGQFVDETTTAREYQQWEIKRPSPIVHKPSLMQQGTIDFSTTNRSEFEEKRPEKVYPIRPTTTNRISGELDLTTTNQIMHGPFPIERVQKIVPQPNLRTSSGAFNSETTNRAQFQEYQIDRPKPIRPISNLRQEGSIDFTTMNQLQFEEKPMEKVSQFRPQTSSKITGEFDGTTTNRVMYQNIIGEKPKAIRPKTNLQVEKGNFLGETTNNREFQNWGYEKATPIKPHSSLRQEGTMDYTTTNSMQFEPKTSQRPMQIRPITSTKITGDFDGTTTNQIMYQNNPLETVRGIRPSTNIHLESGKFEDQTTARREYQSWGMAKTEPIKPSGTLVQEGTMDFTTSNRTDFGVKPMTKTEAIRPHTSSPVTGEFDDTTTNQLQYEEKPIERVSLIRPKTHTKMSEGKFHGETTNQTMFQVPVMESVHTLRPSTNLKSNEGAFQGSTTKADSYQQWKIERPKAFQLTSSLKQEGEMNFETTNNSEFRGKSFERVQQIRPKTSSKIEGEFVATTTNQAMFHQPEKMERVKPIRHQNNLHLEQGKFLDETTTNREYKQWVKMGGQIAVPKKKLQAAGVRTQRERPSRRKEISKMQEKDSNFNLKETEHELRGTQTPHTDAPDSKIEMNSKEVRKDIASDNLAAADNINLHANSEEQATDELKHEEAIRQVQIKLHGDTEDNQDSKDISTIKANYGGKQGTTVEENLPQKKGMASKIENVQQTTSVDQKQAETTHESTKESMSNEMRGNTNYDSWKLAQNENTSITRMSNETGAMSRTVKPEKETPERRQQSIQNMKGTKSYKPPDNLKIEHVPFDGTSTSRTEYKKWEARRSSLKKRSEHLKQEGEMRFDTTSNDYSVLKDYQINRDATKSKVKDDYKGSLTPIGNMEFSTTSKSSYAGVQNVGRAKNLRPRSSLRLGVSDASHQELPSSRSNPEISTTRENYDFTSTSRASYVGHAGTRTRANRPSTSQKVGEGAFEGQSMTRSSFTMPRETVVKSKTIKPESHNILNTENGFSGDTTYRSSFETKKGHCPVLDLEAGKSPLTFKEERNGHVFYAPRVQG